MADRELAWSILKKEIDKAEVGVVSDGTLTVLRAAQELLGLVGLSNISAAPAALRGRILNDINAAMQKVWAKAPKWWSEDTLGFDVFAPVTLAGMTFTNGSKTIGGTLPSWAVGCTVLLGDDRFQNQIASAIELVHPHNGSTRAGAGTGIIYGDCIAVASDNAEIMPISRNVMVPPANRANSESSRPQTAPARPSPTIATTNPTRPLSAHLVAGISRFMHSAATPKIWNIITAISSQAQTRTLDQTIQAPSLGTVWRGLLVSARHSGEPWMS